MPHYDVAVIGAGPIGIACARECAERGLDVVILDRGPILGAMYRYPTHMKFFSTSDRLSICGIPFPSVNAQPTRDEGLEYYRLVAEHPRITKLLYHDVHALLGLPDDFLVCTDQDDVSARRVIVATGFFQRPVLLAVPGEDQDHVSHYFTDGHAYAGLKTVIVGGANSAVIAALECWRHGADVTMIHRGDDFRPGVKYWLRPDLENRIKEGSIAVHWRSSIRSIGQRSVSIGTSQLTHGTIRADRVLLLTGYRADYMWLVDLGLALDEHHRPRIDPTSLESRSRPGVFCAGCVMCGDYTNELFIENGREHAQMVANTIARQLGYPTATHLRHQ